MRVAPQRLAVKIGWIGLRSLDAAVGLPWARSVAASLKATLQCTLRHECLATLLNNAGRALAGLAGGGRCSGGLLLGLPGPAGAGPVRSQPGVRGPGAGSMQAFDCDAARARLWAHRGSFTDSIRT